MRQEEFDLVQLHARVERLEAQNRRWKMASAIAVVVFGSVLVMGAARDERTYSPTIKAGSVEAQEFVLKDANGRIRARLNVPVAKLVPVPGAAPGTVYREFPSHAVPNQAALQFYNEDGDVVWTAPSTPSVLQLK
jgi:hypothetical protein